MKFVAIGRHEILLRTIEMLVDAGHELAGVLTAAPAPEYRADVDDFRSLAARKGVPCHVSNRYGPEMVAALAGLGAEIAVSYNFPRSSVMLRSIASHAEFSTHTVAICPGIAAMPARHGR